MKRVLVAMSGGVDSSTAAILLQQEGYQVLGCTMHLWNALRNPSGPTAGTTRCCSVNDAFDARRVAEQLNFPFYVLNLEREFEKRVIDPFISHYLSGRTPIPCTLCNSFLKFDKLIRFARQSGAEKVATGHYARIKKDPDQGDCLLFKGLDEGKDQSYYLFELTQDQLRRILFPIGEYRKEEVRAIASKKGLATATKPESQEICFVPDGDYSGFIQRHAGEINKDFQPALDHLKRKGSVRFKDGTELGQHQGIFRFTIGQRKGLGIAHQKPLYVMALDFRSNTVWVGYKEDVFSRGLIAEQVNWIPSEPKGKTIFARVRIRSNHLEAEAEIGKRGDRIVRVVFREPQLAVTPGQAAVFYQEDRVLGGGWIRSSFI